jgi:hypothetical protein
MINKLTIPLEQPEYSGLLQVAIAELRDPRDQLRVIPARRPDRELARLGLWPDDPPSPASPLFHVSVYPDPKP